jgi:hypothetical protein
MKGTNKWSLGGLERLVGVAFVEADCRKLQSVPKIRDILRMRAVPRIRRGARHRP